MTQAQAIQLAPVEAPLAKASDPGELSVPQIVARVRKVHEVQREVMREGVHYGNVPGTDKPALLKPGAELLGMVFRLDPQFDVTETRDGDHLTVLARCTLYHAPTGTRLGSGLGSCSTRESKYAWRKGERKCPDCGQPAIITGKAEYGGGFVCFKKKGGCNAKFKSDDARILSQQTGRVPNQDLPDTYNTVLKMAIKRAHVAAILFVTCASEIFTQDVEDQQDDYGAEQPRGGKSVAHQMVDEYDQASPYPQLRDQLEALEASVAHAADYDTVLKLRAELGSKAKPSPLNKAIQAALEGGAFRGGRGGSEFKDLSQRWSRTDRQLAKREAELKPDVTESFRDDDDNDAPNPEDDGR